MTDPKKTTYVGECNQCNTPMAIDIAVNAISPDSDVVLDVFAPCLACVGGMVRVGVVVEEEELPR